MKTKHNLIFAATLYIILMILGSCRHQQREKNRRTWQSVADGVHSWVLRQDDTLFQDSVVRSSFSEVVSALPLDELKNPSNFAITGNPLKCVPLSGEMVCIEKIDNECVAECATECVNVRLSEDEHKHHRAEIYASRLRLYPAILPGKHTVGLEIMEKCTECGPCYNRSRFFYFSGKVKDDKFVFEKYPDLNYLSKK